MNWQDAEIIDVKPLSNTIILLSLKPKTFIDYRAGQYLQIKTKHFENFFSIANAPIGNSYYELHIRHDNQNPSSIELLQHIQKRQPIQIKLPFGKCSLQELNPKLPIIFIAGGTGFAPIKAMIEMLLFQNIALPFECYWGAKSVSDLYWQDQLKHYQTNTPSFQHLTCIVDGDLLAEVLHTHPDDLHQYQFVLSGPFDIVFQFRDRLIAAGVDRHVMHADAFDFQS